MRRGMGVHGTVGKAAHFDMVELNWQCGLGTFELSPMQKHKTKVSFFLLGDTINSLIF